MESSKHQRQTTIAFASKARRIKNQEGGRVKKRSRAEKRRKRKNLDEQRRQRRRRRVRKLELIIILRLIINTIFIIKPLIIYSKEANMHTQIRLSEYTYSHFRIWNTALSSWCREFMSWMMEIECCCGSWSACLELSWFQLFWGRRLMFCMISVPSAFPPESTSLPSVLVFALFRSISCQSLPSNEPQSVSSSTAFSSFPSPPSWRSKLPRRASCPSWVFGREVQPDL